MARKDKISQGGAGAMILLSGWTAGMMLPHCKTAARNWKSVWFTDLRFPTFTNEDRTGHGRVNLCGKLAQFLLKINVMLKKISTISDHLQTGRADRNKHDSDAAEEACPTSHMTEHVDQSRHSTVTSSADHASPPTTWLQCSSREAADGLVPPS